MSEVHEGTNRGPRDSESWTIVFAVGQLCLLSEPVSEIEAAIDIITSHSHDNCHPKDRDGIITER